MSDSQRPTTLTSYNIRTLSVIWILQPLSAPFLVFRVYCRVQERKGRSTIHSWVWADVTLVLTWALELVVQVLNVFEILDTLEQYQDRGWHYMGTIASFVCCFAFWCLRASVVLLMNEIFPGRVSKYLGIIAMVFVTAVVIMNNIWAFSCFIPQMQKGTPLLDIYTKDCYTSNTVTIVYYCPVSLLFDFGAVVLPVFPILRSRMNSHKKLYVISIFALGWLTFAATLVRTVLVFRIITGDVVSGLGDNLTTFIGVEIHVGIIAMSLVTSWRHIRRKIFGTRDGTPIELVDNDIREKPARLPRNTVHKIDTTKYSTTGQSPATSVTLGRDSEC